ncbi:M1 family metallopeptidase [Mucilaginibacter ginsenosidivorax]|uniref:M1 family metallopeptidase n=1 Tax=Mucilaginibacter ginsenosidivorax TaxID=862126 RepID=A0A5B8W6I9_9SPHI|nr:M1 family metallopeptidase [Mucilaginibacter ginsenosidivorax]QEC78532.1 M1 family metallopeptidase [Mucilaginibacter ginsenosidivorax]
MKTQKTTFRFCWSILLPAFLLLSCQDLSAQLLGHKALFTHADTLRGSVTPERAWWNLLHYTIRLTPDYHNKSITGENTIAWRALHAGQRMQLDLQEPMNITAVYWHGRTLKYSRSGDVYYVSLPSIVKAGAIETLTVNFSGKPKEALSPPWDGGWIWAKDEKGRPWMTVACEGQGASVWLPCKDHLGDEPDNGVTMSITVPDSLVAVGNGRLIDKISPKRGMVTYTWNVVNPINSYDIIPYIGKYVDLKHEFNGLNGKLDCEFWALDYNEGKAEQHWGKVDTTLHALEYWMGPYPFYKDGYKLVESSHLGMEHQNAIAYGNHFGNGWLGEDVTSSAFKTKWFGAPMPNGIHVSTGSGWALKWDYILVHESVHEWFGNSITANDLADLWLHEAFACYGEALYVSYVYGVEAGNDYCTSYRAIVGNDLPIIGPYNVNKEGSIDMYMKGANLLHMIRQIMGDAVFRGMLQALNKSFYHQTVTTRQVETFISTYAHKDFSGLFDQYLRTINIPVLEYRTQGQAVYYHWTNCVKGFKMPVKVYVGSATEQWIAPTEKWQKLPAVTEGLVQFGAAANADISQMVVGATGNGAAGDGTLSTDRNFYIMVKRVK